MTWFASPADAAARLARCRLPHRLRHRHDGVPRRGAREAPARRGTCRRREDRARQGGEPRDRRRPGAAAVLRGSRRGAGALRVELQEAAAADPDGGRRFFTTWRPTGTRRRVGPRHLHRRVPADPAAADRDPARRADRPARRRGRQDRRGGRGPAAGDPQRLPGDDPRARHAGRRTPTLRRADLQRQPRAVRGAEAALPLPAPRLPRRRARARDRARARCPTSTSGSRARWSTRWGGCATSS